MADKVPQSAARGVLDKLRHKATVTDEDLKKLQNHVDALENAAANSHDHDSKLAEEVAGQAPAYGGR